MHFPHPILFHAVQTFPVLNKWFFPSVVNSLNPIYNTFRFCSILLCERLKAVKYSVVIPLFNEEENLEPLINCLVPAMEKLNGDFEIIFVDDASTDKTFDFLQRIASTRPYVKVVQLAHNCGQTAALMAGVSHTIGEIVITLDGDLQNDPNDIPKMVRKFDEGFDLVSGWRKIRNDRYFTRVMPSMIANSIISFFSGVPLNDFGCTLKAYKGSFLRNLKLYGEMHRLIPIYMAWEGAKIAEVEVNHFARKFGESKYGLSRIFKVSMDLITVKFLESYVTKPLYAFGGIGLFLVFLGIVSIVWRALLGNEKLGLPGGVVILMGVQFLLMGILAELIIRGYHESTNKKIYKIRQMINIG